MRLLDRLADTFVTLVERWLPEPFTFAVLMTAGAVVLVLLTTDATPVDAMLAWGEGLSMLLPFIAQMALIVLFSYTLAHVGPVRAFIARCASLPRSARGAYVFCCLVTGGFALIAWPLGTTMGALMTRAVGVSMRERGIPVHYPLLGGAAFSGFVVWHMGYSGSAPLFVATPGNAMQAQIGGLIPITDTVFTAWNGMLIVLTLATVAAAACLLHPQDPARVKECWLEDADPQGSAGVEFDRRPGPASVLENSRLVSLALGLALVAYIGHWFATRGLDLNLNIVNWTILALVLLLARSCRDVGQLMAAGGRAVAPVLQQYPLYGGVMGLMLKTGFVAVVAGWFMHLASAGTLPFLAFIVGAFINFFVPSGGAQWAIQGPVFVEAARELGTPLPLVVMGVSYGDQWTNIIHPFIVIVMSILSGLSMQQIFGYSVLLFFAAGIPLGGGLLVLGHL